jgi:hypothetical protein
MHASVCPCPSLEEWEERELDPYAPADKFTLAWAREWVNQEGTPE